MYAKIDGTKIVKYPYTLKDLQRENPNVSFPSVLGDELKAQYSLVDVNENSKPTFDPLKENIVEAPMTVVDGVAQINYTKQTVSEEEQASRVRNQRNSNLQHTDYMALSDVTLTDEWKTYRQALRDVPAQSGFTTSVTWPEPPDNLVAEKGD